MSVIWRYPFVINAALIFEPWGKVKIIGVPKYIGQFVSETMPELEVASFD
jgi:hypothetical protein